MRRDDRLAASRLEGVMAAHAEREKQTLYELRRAGFNFRTITEANKAFWRAERARKAAEQ